MTIATRWLDELAYAGDEHLTARHAAGYEAKAGCDPIDDLHALRRNGFGATSTIVDLGAGTDGSASRPPSSCPIRRRSPAKGDLMG